MLFLTYIYYILMNSKQSGAKTIQKYASSMSLTRILAAKECSFLFTCEVHARETQGGRRHYIQEH